MLEARPVRELNSILVPRLFVEFALAKGVAHERIAAIHDYLVADEFGENATSFRLSGLNGVPDGPAAMALFLCLFTMGHALAAPAWFAACGGIPASVIGDSLAIEKFPWSV